MAKVALELKRSDEGIRLRARIQRRLRPVLSEQAFGARAQQVKRLPPGPPRSRDPQGLDIAGEAVHQTVITVPKYGVEGTQALLQTLFGILRFVLLRLQSICVLRGQVCQARRARASPAPCA